MNRRTPESDGLATSASLIARVRGRDDVAWSELIELYAPLVYYWCRKTNIPEQDIADVLQDVFRSVVTNIATFRNDRPSDTFRGWLRTVTRSRLNDYFRQQARIPLAAGGSDFKSRIERVPDPIGEDSDAEETRLENVLFHRGLDRIRQHFDPRTWQAFWRTAVDGLTAADAAAELGMQPGAVRVAKSRVLQRLRQQLGDLE